jgi:lysophospholipase L1-like esterase
MGIGVHEDDRKRMKTNGPRRAIRGSRGRLLGLPALILLLLPAFPAAAQDGSVSLVFTDSQHLAVVGRRGASQAVYLGTGAGFEAMPGRALRIPVPFRQANDVLRKDGFGRLYLVWEELGPKSGGVGFGRMTPTGSVEPEPVRLPSGWNRLPDLGFDSGNGSWLTWVNARTGGQVLYVRQNATGRTWRVAEAGAFLRPRVMGDAAGRIWLFWGETSATSFRLLCRVWAGGQWSPALPVVEAGRQAISSFDAALDASGSPWIAWSRSDGKSYGIFVRHKTSGTWSTPVSLSGVAGTQNVAPSIGIAPGSGPVVAWVRMTGRTSAFAVRALTVGGWTPETALPGVEAGRALPQIAVEAGRLAVAWMAKAGPRSRVFDLSRLGPASSGPVPSAALSAWLAPILKRWVPSLISNPDLSESSYIGFGDSITYGVIDSDYHPELGYVPRLQVLLTEDFGTSKVYNAGFGSEITAHGLARLDDVLAADLARYLLILEGTNDTMTLIYNPDVTAANLRQMVSDSRDFGSFPALATLLPRFDVEARPERIEEVNDRIRDLAALLSVPLVDFHTLFSDYPESDGGVLSLLSEDLLHPNEKGYQFMADHWFETIRAFPFPPVNVQLQRQVDRIFFYEQPGNRLTWEDNSKIFDKTQIQGYRVYRKLAGAGDDAFALLANVVDATSYFDTAIVSGTKYTYVITTVTIDGLEGPASASVEF